MSPARQLFAPIHRSSFTAFLTAFLLMVAASALAQPGDLVDPLPPDFDQVRDGLPSYLGGPPGGNFCGPTSSADMLYWLGDNGFPLVWSWGSSESEVTDAILDIALELDPQVSWAVTPTGLRNGLQDILDDSYLYMFNVFYYGRDSEDECFDDEGRDFANIIHCLELGHLVIARIGWYHLNPPAPTGYGKRCNGHFVAITGYDHIGADDWVRFMDPARIEDCATTPPPCVALWKTTLENFEIQDTDEPDAGPFSPIEASKWHYERTTTTSTCCNLEIRTPVQDGFAVIVENEVFTLPHYFFEVVQWNLARPLVNPWASVVEEIQGIIIDPFLGAIIVCGLESEVLYRTDLLTGVTTEFVTEVPLAQPRGLSYGLNETLYILHGSLTGKAAEPPKQIVALAPDGDLLATAYLTGSGAFAYHDRTQRVYWWNGTDNRLQAYSWDLEPIGQGISLPPSPNFTPPAYLAADPNGDILYFNHDGSPLIFRFDLAAGNPLPPISAQAMTDPAGMVVTDGGQLYVAQETYSPLFHFDENGAQVLDSPVTNVMGRKLLALNRPPRSPLKTSTNPGDLDINNGEPVASGIGDIPSATSDDLRLTAQPNPFNPRVDIRFELPVRAGVSLEVFGISGKLVTTLMNGKEMAGGPQTVTWNGTDQQGRAAPAGVYLCRLTAGDLSSTLRVALVR